MRLALTLTEVEALARRHYRGSSTPLSQVKSDDRPDDPDWWRFPKKREDFNSQRHAGALKLYLELAKHAVASVSQACFPARFEISDAKPLRPDKGFIKMCVNSEPALLMCRIENGILLFEVTPAGSTRLEAP